MLILYYTISRKALFYLKSGDRGNPSFSPLSISPPGALSCRIGAGSGAASPGVGDPVGDPPHMLQALILSAFHEKKIIKIYNKVLTTYGIYSIIKTVKKALYYKQIHHIKT